MSTQDLSDLKTQFYAIMEPYPSVYANYKVNPDLPSASDAYNRMNATLTSLHQRMFTFQAAVENGLDQRETATNDLTKKNAKLNAILARKTALYQNAVDLTTGTPVNSYTPTANSPNPTATPSPTPTPTPSPNQISLVSEAKSIEKTDYTYSIFRIIYLLLGIFLISYFIYKTVGKSNVISASTSKYNANVLDKMDKMRMRNNPY
jgi:hypothetical protein